MLLALVVCVGSTTFIPSLLVVLPSLLQAPDYIITSKVHAIQQLANFTFPVTSIPFSQWDDMHASFVNNNQVYYVVQRNGRNVEAFPAATSNEQISSAIQDAGSSFVIPLNQTLLEDFDKFITPHFILHGTEVPDEFEDAAFLFRATETTFSFIPSNETSIVFKWNKNGVRRVYDGKTTLSHWILTCQSLDTPQNTPTTHISEDGTKPLIHLTAITNSHAEFARDAWLRISKWISGVDFEVRSWENATDLLSPCMIEEDELTFVLHNFGTRKIENCFVFQDMDVFSPELLLFFVRSRMAEVHSKQARRSPSPKSEGVKKLGVLQFQERVPDQRFLTVVFFTGQSSISKSQARLIFRMVASDFADDNVVFYESGPTIGNHPSFDGFPLIAMYRPNNSQPLIFRQTLTREKLTSWIEPYIPRSVPDLDELKAYEEIEISLGNDGSLFRFLNMMSSVFKFEVVHDNEDNETENREAIEDGPSPSASPAPVEMIRSPSISDFAMYQEEPEEELLEDDMIGDAEEAIDVDGDDLVLEEEITSET